jgi:hypothetical protein
MLGHLLSSPMLAAGLPRVVFVVVAFALAGCARSKSTPAGTAPADSASAASSAVLATRPGSKGLLCRDGLHEPGDHWKEVCNLCRCAADGDITCTRFVCGDQ